jgi:alkanesulfonate monooxygenase SsuD/methylene tetrahydromethanopterin reductase-like flavin-dependent oxidoreductase (luciferase family)
VPALRFGLSVTPAATDLASVRAAVRAADAAGLDLVGVQDHPYQRRFVDTFALMATLLADTERITVFPDVANLPLRPPAVLAKTAATLDLLSGGRFELGLGAGGFWDAIAAMDGPRRTPGESVDALAEAIAVIRLMWSGRRGVRYAGVHHRLSGVHAGPAPAHPVGIWVGAYGPRMLGLVGRLADGWVPSLAYSTPERLRESQARIDAAAEAAGRDPATIRRILNVGGTPESAAELVPGLAADGFDTFVLWPDGDPADAPAHAERWAELTRRD